MLTAIVNEINARAERHDIGRLQEIRKRLKGLSHAPTQKLFSTQTTFERYAFHHGGRKELQFNVGLETLGGEEHLRHGVAFSFKTNQTLPSIDVLLPKTERFNEFLRVHPEECPGLRMWHWRKIKGKDKRSERPDQLPSPIQRELRTPGVFVFLGQLQPTKTIDYE
jgi:hypothetical protein